VVFAVRHVSRRTAKNGQRHTAKKGPGARWTMPFAVRLMARRMTKGDPGARCTSPIAVRLVARRTTKNGQFAVRCPRRTTNLLLRQVFLGQFAVGLPYSARQIDPIFLFFFCFSRPKISKKHRHDIYITISITDIIYIATCIIYVTISITDIIYNNIHHKSTPKSEVHRQVHTKVHNSSTVHIVHHSS
jgi:hypothetical protein